MTDQLRRREIHTLADIQHNSQLLILGLAAKGGSGLRDFLTQLYPDQAHFLYELLQNAEDAGASTVRFMLHRDRLIFAHNGPVLFSLYDIDSITNVADSTKRDDHTRIGKFGVGFKAVYDFTNSPEIHSGVFRFKIVDLFYPDDQIPELAHDGVDGMGTVFDLPFDRPEKPAEEAFQQVSAGLTELASTTLLFLRNIRQLTFSIDGESDGSIERVEHRGRLFTLKTTHSAETEETRWLRVERDVEVVDEEGQATNVTVAAAFQVTSSVADTPKPRNSKAGAENGAMKFGFAPVESGEVCIFFPTAKERSGLKFHIHAPFESTVGRDSIRDTPVNETLIRGLSGLIADSTVALAQGGNLPSSFLDLLPLHSDPVSAAYWPIRDAVIAAFDTIAITPCRTGGHAPASELQLGTKTVMSLFTDSDMHFLLSQAVRDRTSYEADKTPVFVKLPGENNLRARAFITQLFTKQVDADTVLGLVGNIDSEIEETVEPQRIENLGVWLSGFSDKRLRSFYKLLGESDDFALYDFSNIALLRVVGDSSGFRHVNPPEALLPDQHETGLPMQISPEIWRLGETKNRDAPAIRDFLETIGVRIWNAEAALAAELESIGSELVTSNDRVEHDEIERVSRFVEAAALNPTLSSTFKRFRFLLAVGANGDLIRVSPGEAYFSGEIERTGWESVAAFVSTGGGRSQAPLWNGYAAIPNVADFLHGVGVSGRPRIIWINVGHNRSFQTAWTAGKASGYRENEDWILEHAAVLMKHGNAVLLRSIWLWALGLDKKYLRACYQHNRQAGRNYMKSNLIHVLTENAWIENLDGNFCKPADVDRDTLHSGLHYQDSPLLAEIGLGSTLSLQTSQVIQRESVAHELGFDDAAHAEAARRLTEGMSAEEIIRLVDERKLAAESPENAAYGERRARLTAEDVEALPLRKSHMRERSVRVEEPRLREERRAYLKAIYERAGSMLCQACLKRMPFQGPDGSDYFEAVQCVDHTTEFKANAVALCPVCSAKFRSWRLPRSEVWRDEVRTFPLAEGETSARLTLELAGVESTIHFAGKHLKDIQILLDA